MVFKYVAVGLLAVGALGATYVAKTGGCSAPAAYDDTAADAVATDDCSGCPIDGTADAAVESSGLAADVLASNAVAGSDGPCTGEAAEECAISEPECVAKPDCEDACEACEFPCDTPCDSQAKPPAESTPSD